MIIDPFKKMQNYIELSHKVLPSGQIDTSVIRKYISDKNEYEDIISLTENKINKGLINTNQISKYFKFNTKTDITTPSEILKKYKEAQTESSINSIIGILKDIIFKNIDSVDSVTKYYQDNIEIFKKLDHKTAKKRLKDNLKKDYYEDQKDLITKDPVNYLRDYLLGIDPEASADERLNKLFNHFKKLKDVTYTFDGQEGREKAFFSRENFELNKNTTLKNLKEIVKQNIDLHTKEKLFHIALEDSSTRKMILDKHLGKLLKTSLNDAMSANYNSIQDNPLNEITYNMPPRSQKELEKLAYKTKEEAAKEEYISKNPCTKVKPIKYENKE